MTLLDRPQEIFFEVCPFPAFVWLPIRNKIIGGLHMKKPQREVHVTVNVNNQRNERPDDWIGKKWKQLVFAVVTGVLILIIKHYS